jgi:hypothetical protein
MTATERHCNRQQPRKLRSYTKDYGRMECYRGQRGLKEGTGRMHRVFLLAWAIVAITILFVAFGHFRDKARFCI